MEKKCPVFLAFLTIIIIIITIPPERKCNYAGTYVCIAATIHHELHENNYSSFAAQANKKWIFIITISNSRLVLI